MNLKNLLFLCLIASNPLHLFSAAESTTVSETTAEEKEELATQLKEALRKKNIFLALELFEKGAPATISLFNVYCGSCDFTRERDQIKKIFNALTPTDQKKISGTLETAIQRSNFDLASFLIDECGAKGTNPALRYLCQKVADIDETSLNNPMSRYHATDKKLYDDTLTLFKKILGSMEGIPSSDQFLIYSVCPLTFTEELIKKGCQPEEGQLYTIIRSSHEKHTQKKKLQLATWILKTNVKISDDEVSYICTDYPSLKGLRAEIEPRYQEICKKEQEEKKRQEETKAKRKEEKKEEERKQKELEEIRTKEKGEKSSAILALNYYPDIALTSNDYKLLDEIFDTLNAYQKEKYTKIKEAHKEKEEQERKRKEEIECVKKEDEDRHRIAREESEAEQLKRRETARKEEERREREQQARHLREAEAKRKKEEQARIKQEGAAKKAELKKEKEAEKADLLQTEKKQREEAARQAQLETERKNEEEKKRKEALNIKLLETHKKQEEELKKQGELTSDDSLPITQIIIGSAAVATIAIVGYKIYQKIQRDKEAAKKKKEQKPEESTTEKESTKISANSKN